MRWHFEFKEIQKLTSLSPLQVGGFEALLLLIGACVQLVIEAKYILM